MIFEQYIPNNKTAFLAKVREVASSLSIKPEWLMAVMFMESSLDPTEVNPDGGATGLIQFMPKTAIGLGTTTEELRRMSNVAQMDYVQRYFYPYRHKIDSFDDLYLITFYPNADGKDGELGSTLTKDESWAFPPSVIRQNRKMDVNGDGRLTIADFRQWIWHKIPEEYRNIFASDLSIKIGKAIKRNAPLLLGLALLSTIIAWFVYNEFSKRPDQITQ